LSHFQGEAERTFEPRGEAHAARGDLLHAAFCASSSPMAGGVPLLLAEAATPSSRAD